MGKEESEFSEELLEVVVECRFLWCEADRSSRSVALVWCWHLPMAPHALHLSTKSWASQCHELRRRRHLWSKDPPSTALPLLRCPNRIAKLHSRWVHKKHQVTVIGVWLRSARDFWVSNRKPSSAKNKLKVMLRSPSFAHRCHQICMVALSMGGCSTVCRRIPNGRGRCLEMPTPATQWRFQQRNFRKSESETFWEKVGKSALEFEHLQQCVIHKAWQTL